MNGQETLESVREINLSYFMLAQRMLREDRAVGTFRLGLSAPIADLLCGLTLEQIVRLANTDQLLCVFRFSDDAMLTALTAPTARANVGVKHAAILLAGQSAEALR
jgi:flagellar transcriptional activator FlhD